jgi:adenine phosphoribosyltransferase
MPHAARDEIERLSRVVEDFPTPGVTFRDLSPVFADGPALRSVIDALVAPFAGQFDAVAGMEARGFVLAAGAAYATGLGCVMIRKAGKLPRGVISEDFDLEYGSATLEVHPDEPGCSCSTTCSPPAERSRRAARSSSARAGPWRASAWCSS